MRAILESVAAKAATGWQRAGSKFDFEVFALPGGSVIAPALWVYTVAMSALKNSRQRSVDQQPAIDGPAAAEGRLAARAVAERTSVAQSAQAKRESSMETGLSCPWPRCHCT
jgi:hypothetical protein